MSAVQRHPDSGSAGVGDLGLLSTGSQNCLSRTVCAPPLNTHYPAYYGLQLTAALTVPGSRLADVTSDSAAVNVHAVLRPDGSLVVLAVNTDPSQARSADGRHAGWPRSLPVRGIEAIRALTRRR